MVKGSQVWLESRLPVVAGRIIHVVPRSIAVEITEPYTGIGQSVAIPYFACWFPSVQYFQSGGSITPHGEATADRLLLELDRSCRCFDRNRTELACAYLRLATEIATKASGIDEPEFRARRSVIRRRLRDREISSIEYQRALNALRRSVRKPPMVAFEAASGLSRDIFAQHGLRIPYGTVQQLVTKFLI